MFKMEFIRRCPAVPGGARGNGGRDVETEPHQPRVMARITAVKQTLSKKCNISQYFGERLRSLELHHQVGLASGAWPARTLPASTPRRAIQRY